MFVSELATFLTEVMITREWETVWEANQLQNSVSPMLAISNPHKTHRGQECADKQQWVLPSILYTDWSEDKAPMRNCDKSHVCTITKGVVVKLWLIVVVASTESHLHVMVLCHLKNKRKYLWWCLIYSFEGYGHFSSPEYPSVRGGPVTT